MRRPRSLDEHLQLHAAFAVTVSEFDASTWSRIHLRCTAFDEQSLIAAFKRAQIRALPHGYPASRMAGAMTGGVPFPLRLVATASTVLQTGIALGFELTQLVPQLREAAWAPPLTTQLSPRAAQYGEAQYRMDRTLDALPGPALGMRAGIHAAAAAVLYHDFLSEHDFAVSYQVVSPELSFAELERRAIVV